MGGDGGENTGVPCLAVVRYAVATLVGLVAFSVVVMVITVVRRPEDIQFFINHGYVTAKGPEVDVGCTPQQCNPTIRVVFTASNPNGRSDVTCNNITVGLLNIMSLDSSSSTPGMETIVKFNMSKPFDLPKESTHTDSVTEPIQEDQWCYILGRCKSATIFKFAVMVNLYASPLNKKKHGSSFTFYCWPITVNCGYSDLDSTDDDVPCNKIDDKDLPQPRQFPALPPAPAPAATCYS